MYLAKPFSTTKYQINKHIGINYNQEFAETFVWSVLEWALELLYHRRKGDRSYGVIDMK